MRVSSTRPLRLKHCHGPQENVRGLLGVQPAHVQNPYRVVETFRRGSGELGRIDLVVDRGRALGPVAAGVAFQEPGDAGPRPWSF